VPGDRAGRRPFDGGGAGLTPEDLEARLRGPADLTDADLDALEAMDRLNYDRADDDLLDCGREPPSEEELYGLVFDPDDGPVEGWEVMSDEQRRHFLGATRTVSVTTPRTCSRT
jgi:hypothetical protein